MAESPDSIKSPPEDCTNPYASYRGAPDPLEHGVESLAETQQAWGTLTNVSFWLTLVGINLFGVIALISAVLALTWLESDSISSEDLSVVAVIGVLVLVEFLLALSVRAHRRAMSTEKLSSLATAIEGQRSFLRNSALAVLLLISILAVTFILV
jgi:hypothetical protein